MGGNILGVGRPLTGHWQEDV